MTAATLELVQVHQQKLKNINFSIVDIGRSQVHERPGLGLGLVLCGTMELNGTGPVSAGDLILLNSYDSYKLHSKEGARILLMQLAPSFGTAYFARIANVQFQTNLLDRLDRQVYDKICRYLLSAAQVYFEEPTAYGLECAAWVSGLVTLLLRQVPHQVCSEAEVMTKKKKISRYQRIAAFLDQHYRERLTLGDLARSEGITSTYMSRIFAELFHKTFQEYLSEFRLTKAVPLLKDPGVYLVDISMECGFSDPRYLNAVCQKQYGCTAAQLREKLIRGEISPVAEGVAAIEEPGYSDAASVKIIRDYISEHKKRNGN